ncbi:hydrogenase maturation protease [uncultured Meiothermus sp.]|jgi:hydrogenase maturation protease|uniref:hydrogenase maturation protease n=1 Tax=uncultured Meiothermus sp. TaxID=157471 RepID=UPI0026201E95|nr:hydrogenase maturation protease [uncultured Meiothermus sp.]
MAHEILLLGVGNLLYGDEGVGVVLVRRLKEKYAFSERLEIVDGGTLAWDLLPLIAGREQVIVVDAVAAELGEIYRFSLHDIPSAIQYGKLSSHEWEMPELLTAMEIHGDLPPVTFIAIGVNSLAEISSSLTLELSLRIASRLEALEKAVLQELASLGVQPLSEAAHA